MKAVHELKNLLYQQLAPQCAMLKGDRTYHIAQLPSPYSIVRLFEVTKVVPTEPKLVIMRKLLLKDQAWPLSGLLGCFWPCDGSILQCSCPCDAIRCGHQQSQYLSL